VIFTGHLPAVRLVILPSRVPGKRFLVLIDHRVDLLRRRQAGRCHLGQILPGGTLDSALDQLRVGGQDIQQVGGQPLAGRLGSHASVDLADEAIESLAVLAVLPLQRLQVAASATTRGG
jgi:hypothetical protein